VGKNFLRQDLQADKYLLIVTLLKFTEVLGFKALKGGLLRLLSKV